MNPTDLTLEASAMITSSGKGDTGKISDLNAPQLRRVASDLTAAMQLIYTLAPSIYKRSVGADFGDPVTSTLTATDGSDVVTTSYAFGEGCSVYVGGAMNEIRTEGGVKRLRFPYSGANGAVPAVFYQDCKVLDSSIAKVIGPVSVASLKPGQIGHGCPIRKLDNRADAERLRLRCGVPQHYWVEPFLSAGNPASLLVAGTLIPDVTGIYPPIGVGDGGSVIYAQDSASGLRYISYYVDGVTWYLQAWNGVGGNWQLGSASPAGAYAPFGGSSGTATVTLIPAQSQQSTLRLRLVPVPEHRITISYDVTLRAPKFTAADLGTDLVTSTKSLVIAEDYQELFVRPIFLNMFAGSPWFKGDKQYRDRLMMDDKQARSLLHEYRAQQESNRRITAL